MNTEREGIPTDYDRLASSEWGLDEGDTRLTRAKLELTPPETRHRDDD